MIINFPPPPGNITQYFVTQVLDILRKAFLSVVSKDQAAPHVLLSSPNGTVYSVTVTDTGVVQTAAISGKTRDI